ncbi:hypothetical protein SESBI_17110 [Sesbania bispinosa]|nr:hypothetical protein SESBI_17110 [Sesbania bispinosa]
MRWLFTEGGEMAGNNELAMAEKKARREAQKAATAAAAATTMKNVSTLEGEESSKAHAEKRPRVEDPPVQGTLAKPTCTGPTFTTLKSSSGESTSSKITWATLTLRKVLL